MQILSPKISIYRDIIAFFECRNYLVAPFGSTDAFLVVMPTHTKDGKPYRDYLGYFSWIAGAWRAYQDKTEFISAAIAQAEEKAIAADVEVKK